MNFERFGAPKSYAAVSDLMRFGQHYLGSTMWRYCDPGKFGNYWAIGFRLPAMKVCRLFGVCREGRFLGIRKGGNFFPASFMKPTWMVQKGDFLTS